MNTDAFDSLSPAWPSSWQVEYAEIPIAEPLADLRSEIESQLALPLASLPLADLCGRGTKVVIACDDDPLRATLLASVLNEFERAGVAAEDVTLLVTAHPDREPTPQQEWSQSEYAAHISVVHHDPDDVREVDDLGIFEGVPLSVNYRAVEADLLIGISILHLDDGASDAGSLATVAIGCASIATIRELRTTRFLDDRIEQPAGRAPLFDRVVREGARRAGLVFAIDALVDENDCALAVKAGAPTAVNDALHDHAMMLREALAGSSAYDVVIAEASQQARESAKADLFDMSRAAINVALSRNPVLMRGGSLILSVPAGQRERGEDRAEARLFYDALTNGDTLEFVIQQLQGRSLRSGEDRAYLLAHVMQRNFVIAAGSGDANLAHASHFIPSRHVREAVELAENFVGRNPKALVVRNALWATPIYAGPRYGSDPTDDIIVELPDYS